MLTQVLLLLLPALLLLLDSSTVAHAQQSPQSFSDVRITSISGCTDVGAVTVNCSVATTTLLIRTAAGFPAATDWLRSPPYITARLNGYSYFTTTATWLNPSDPTNSSVYVNVTAGGYYPHITGQLVSVWLVQFATYWLSAPPGTPSFDGFSYAFDQPPTLTSVSGCDGGGQSTLNCLPDYSILTLTGSGLLWLSTGSTILLNLGSGSASLDSISVRNDSYATLPLVDVYSTILSPQHYGGALLSFNLTSVAYGRTGGREYSYTTNSLQISFAPLPPPNITDWYVPHSCGLQLASSAPLRLASP